MDNTTKTAPNKEKKDKTEVSLEEEHQKLLQELYTQVENKRTPVVEPPRDTSRWSKEKLSEEILKIGTKLGQTHYHSVLMNSSREYLRKQLHSLVNTLTEEKRIPNQKIKTKKNKKRKKRK